MQNSVRKKTDTVSIRVSRETHEALSRIKHPGQSYDSVIRELIRFMKEGIYISGYDGWSIKTLFPNINYET